MKRIAILTAGIILLLAASCRKSQDTRYFAPELEFSEEGYSVQSESGGADIVIRFSRPAQFDFRIGLNFSGPLREGVQFRVPSHSIDVAVGDTEARLHIDLVDDEIWDESSWIGISIAAGPYYTVNPDGKCVTRVNISKAIVLPTLRLASPAGEVVTNPFRAETLHFEISADRAPVSDIPVTLDLGGLVPGTDCLVNGGLAPEITLPAGATSVPFDIAILYKDESGLDLHVPLALVQKKGSYIVSSEAGALDIHLNDPSVNFTPLWKSPALNNGTGYQLRQAILSPDGEWAGNLAADFFVSSEGSNYLRNFRNMYDSSWSCKANSSGGNALRLTEFFPNYAYPNEITILDYGSGSNTRFFSPVDSLMRFVLDPGETEKGDIVLTKPRTFIAFTGVYADWQAEGSDGKRAWQSDSRATGGDIFASKHPALANTVTVTLERLEGRFDLGNKTQPLHFTAWFHSDDPHFMENVDLTQFAITREDGLWKVEYMVWPR
jgi:hypothetical protein